MRGRCCVPQCALACVSEYRERFPGRAVEEVGRLLEQLRGSVAERRRQYEARRQQQERRRLLRAVGGGGLEGAGRARGPRASVARGWSAGYRVCAGHVHSGRARCMPYLCLRRLYGPKSAAVERVMRGSLGLALQEALARASERTNAAGRLATPPPPPPPAAAAAPAGGTAAGRGAHAEAGAVASDAAAGSQRNGMEVDEVPAGGGRGASASNGQRAVGATAAPAGPLEEEQEQDAEDGRGPAKRRHSSVGQGGGAAGAGCCPSPPGSGGGGGAGVEVQGPAGVCSNGEANGRTVDGQDEDEDDKMVGPMPYEEDEYDRPVGPMPLDVDSEEEHDEGEEEGKLQEAAFRANGCGNGSSLPGATGLGAHNGNGTASGVGSGAASSDGGSEEGRAGSRRVYDFRTRAAREADGDVGELSEEDEEGEGEGEDQEEEEQQDNDSDDDDGPASEAAPEEQDPDLELFLQLWVGAGGEERSY